MVNIATPYFPPMAEVDLYERNVLARMQIAASGHFWMESAEAETILPPPG
jgi:hypothetical protein